jgi:hypothetical protein
MGGLAGVHEAEEKKQEEGEKEEGEKEHDMSEAAPVGKSLFVSMKVTTWEEDENVVLDVGWAAVWWQKRIGEEVKEGERLYEEMREFGHYMWVVQI